ncbi:polyribonucleotide nucleotidyltransferase [Candidatus Fokinia crypta]|uniref:polyribonucleotide nucleotidyltransferase n=1 Tax=Candidatus Fokinia crypta TaxID=1920990 RepID=A0ABZ0UQL1_9RICK|nr:polyribonucleotide nucleotidyltransferase [Candidatus Fokinia cryptica]WPX97957.1 Polyribonucleotide nucleotidyltransferase [Candidatus Fokinia cryptica]
MLSDTSKIPFVLRSDYVQLETGALATQSDASVVVKYGDTTVLCVVVSSQLEKDMGFLPLQVNYHEKFYASGKIPGGFIKRETKLSEREILIARRLDRQIRPLFDSSCTKTEIQISCTTLSYDPKFDPEIAASLGVSAALLLSDLPFRGPVCMVKGTIFQNIKSEIITAFTDASVVMIEGKFPECTTDEFISALETIRIESNVEKLITLVKDFVQEYKIREKNSKNQDINSDIAEINSVFMNSQHVNIQTKLEKHNILCNNLMRASNISKYLEQIYLLPDKKARKKNISILRKCLLLEITNLYSNHQTEKSLFKNIDNITKAEFYELWETGLPIEAISHFVDKYISVESSSIMRKNLKHSQVRLDGRKPDEIRMLEASHSYIPTAHGSALFSRGETQVLAVITLGGKQDEQISETMIGSSRENFMLHYNFPKWSVGEISASPSLSRREIGHGNLALSAISGILPNVESFDYTIRVVADVLSSNGSSSMATVCASSIALMDAGVPISKHVAGVAVGVVKIDNELIVLSDISGDEDQLGDMDLKITGTRDGFTAIQMDIKIPGVQFSELKTVLNKAKLSLDSILNFMYSIINMPSISSNSPQTITLKIPKEKIRNVIGQGGSTIKHICATSGAKIDIRDTGETRIFGSVEAIEKAQQMIADITKDVEVGQVYDGLIMKVVDFGCFVKLPTGVEGLLHVSEIPKNDANLFVEGYRLKVKVIKAENGRISLTAHIEHRTTHSKNDSFNDGEDNGRQRTKLRYRKENSSQDTSCDGSADSSNKKWRFT